MQRTPIWPDLTVLQLGDRTACAFAAKLLAELGANCILVESPDPPRAADERSSRFTSMHWGMRSLALDYATPGGLDRLAALAPAVDVLIREPLPAPLEEEWRARRGEAGRLIELVLSPFGEDGPYAGFVADSGAILALSGNTYTNGDPAREPLTTQRDVTEHFAGLEGFASILAALHRRARTDEGDRIELSLLETALAFDEYNLLLAAATEVVRRRFHSRLVFGYPSDVFPCRDGYVVIMAGQPHHMEGIALLIERPDLIETPLVVDGNYRALHWRELEALLLPWLAERTRQQVVEQAQELRVPISPVLGMADLLDHPHVIHRATIRRERDAAGEVALVAPPFRLDSHAPSQGPAPARGEHSDEVLTQLSTSRVLKKRRSGGS